jgi:hypothetical protein
MKKADMFSMAAHFPMEEVKIREKIASVHVFFSLWHKLCDRMQLNPQAFSSFVFHATKCSYSTGFFISSTVLFPVFFMLLP